jgi:hypothetical protein
MLPESLLSIRLVPAVTAVRWSSPWPERRKRRPSRSIPPHDRQPREECFSLGGAEQGGMPEVVVGLVRGDVLFDPAKVAQFGSVGVMLDAESLTDLFEQFHGSSSCWCSPVALSGRQTKEQPTQMKFAPPASLHSVWCYPAESCCFCVIQLKAVHHRLHIISELMYTINNPAPRTKRATKREKPTVFANTKQ